MKNFIFLLLASDIQIKNPGLVLLIGLSIFGVLIALIIYNIRNLSRNAEEDTYRKTEPPICVWKFSEADWKEYSSKFLNYKNPSGSGEIRFTVFDIWVTDANGTRRQRLNAGKFYALTDCRMTENGIKIRIRSVNYRGRNAPHFKVLTFKFLVPDDKRADGVKIVDAWKQFMADNSDVIDEVTPNDKLTGLFGENDF